MYVPYAKDVERVSADEDEVIDKIIRVMSKGAGIVREREGRALRASHAKAHGLARGELTVLPDLPAELRQGLFAAPRSYSAIVRLAHVPGELLDDRKVSTPRGLALKVLGVEGEMLPGNAGQTQDWVLDTGEIFNAADAKTFLGEITMTEASTPMPEGVKSVVSTISAATNAMLNAVGGNSANLDFFGHPKLHPLTETYYSQAPLRYGDYIAKLRVRPTSSHLEQEQALDLEDANGLRTAVTRDLRTAPATFAVEVQLCTDLDKMPVENAHTLWSQDDSPFRQVATLTLPVQDAWSDRSEIEEAHLSFAPGHSLAAHRPLGSIMRARMRAYSVMSQTRAVENGLTIIEPEAAALGAAASPLPSS